MHRSLSSHIQRWGRVATPLAVLAALTGAAFVAAIVTFPSAAAPTSIDATRFLDTLGVDIHAEYTDGKYADVARVIDDLAYLGIHHVRDATLSPGNQGQGSYDILAKAGVTFDLFVQGGDVEERVSRIAAFERLHRGAVASIEGPNEVNNFPIAYGGKTGDAAAIAFQAALYRRVKSDPTLKSVPVFAVTSWPELITDADYANAHPYPKGRAQPRQTVVDAVAGQHRIMPGKPIVFTEAGYYTLPESKDWGGVDELSQAKMSLNLLMDAARLGVYRTFLYELLDAYPDPDHKDISRHFGLIAIDNRPKLTAIALHNLTSIVTDKGAPPGSRAPSPSVDPQVTGLPPTGARLLVRKASGATALIVWNEPPLFDASGSRPIDVEPVEISVDLGRRAKVKIFDLLAGPRAIAKYPSTTAVTLDITDHPIVIEIAAPP